MGYRDSDNTTCHDIAIAVNGRRLLRELSFPATDSVVLTAIVTFALLGLLALHAGLLGLWLGVILLPAVFRYLLMLLEARALGRATPVAGIELFNIFDNFWSLAPLVLVAVAVWGGILLDGSVSPLAAGALWTLLAVALPASLAILAISRREYLPRLLSAGRDVEAVKLLSRCLLQDGSFRPGVEDRDEIRELLERHRRADLMSALDL